MASVTFIYILVLYEHVKAILVVSNPGKVIFISASYEERHT